MLAINARVPMLTSDETPALAKWHDDAEVEGWQRIAETLGAVIEWSETEAHVFERLSKERREEADGFRSIGGLTSMAVNEVRTAIANGDRETPEGMSEHRQSMLAETLRLLAEKPSGPTFR